MYFVYVTGPLGQNTRLTLAKFVTHVYTELWTSTLSVNAGDTLYLGAQGSTLTVKLNGATVTTQTDGSITSPVSPVSTSPTTTDTARPGTGTR